MLCTVDAAFVCSVLPADAASLLPSAPLSCDGDGRRGRSISRGRGLGQNVLRLRPRSTDLQQMQDGTGRCFPPPPLPLPLRPLLLRLCVCVFVCVIRSKAGARGPPVTAAGETAASAVPASLGAAVERRQRAAASPLDGRTGRNVPTHLHQTRDRRGTAEDRRVSGRADERTFIYLICLLLVITSSLIFTPGFFFFHFLFQPHLWNSSAPTLLPHLCTYATFLPLRPPSPTYLWSFRLPSPPLFFSSSFLLLSSPLSFPSSFFSIFPYLIISQLSSALSLSVSSVFLFPHLSTYPLLPSSSSSSAFHLLPFLPLPSSQHISVEVTEFLSSPPSLSLSLICPLSNHQS